jgi:hypothetical protein
MVEDFMASEKVTVMLLPTLMFVALLAGTTLNTVGAVESPEPPEPPPVPPPDPPLEVVSAVTEHSSRFP